MFWLILIVLCIVASTVFFILQQRAHKKSSSKRGNERSRDFFTFSMRTTIGNDNNADFACHHLKKEKIALLLADGVSDTFLPQKSANYWCNMGIQPWCRDDLISKAWLTQKQFQEDQLSMSTVIGAVFDSTHFQLDWLAIGDSYLVCFSLQQAIEYFKQPTGHIRDFSMLVNRLHSRKGVLLASQLYDQTMPHQFDKGRVLAFAIGQNETPFTINWTLSRNSTCPHYGSFTVPYSDPVILATSDGIFDCLSHPKKSRADDDYYHQLEIIMAVVVSCYQDQVIAEVGDRLIAVAAGHGMIAREDGNLKFIGKKYDCSSIGEILVAEHQTGNQFGRMPNNKVKDDLSLAIILPKL